MIRLIKLAATLLLLCAALPGSSQPAAERAEELSRLLQQQEALKREQEQYETSMRLLRAKNSSPGAILTLEEQVDGTRLELLELQEQELKLRRSMAASGTGTEQGKVGGVDAERLEVQRLKILLARYYSEEERAKARGAVIVTADSANRAETPRAYAVEQVLLTGAESISALNDITARLESDSVLSSQRREVDIVYHVEIRRGGSLVSSKSHSLKALGRSQYVGKVSLGSGKAVITIKASKWSTQLAGEEESDYFVTLSTPFDQPAELHLIPVQALTDTGWADLPSWLPYIGTAKGA